MNKNRMEAFSDGVLAILITIMVLELKAPSGSNLDSLKPLAPVFLSYVLSFIYLGIYWNNHHHLMHAVKAINGGVLWANLHLLFWLSMIPFVTTWMGQNNFAPLPVAVYGINLLLCAIAYYILQLKIIALHKNALLIRAIGKDLKGKISPMLYVVAIFSCLLSPWIAGGIYALVALIWLIPDRRIEHMIDKEQSGQ